jgi:hypothetical protein
LICKNGLSDPVFSSRASLHMTNPLTPLPTEPRPGRYRHYKGNEYRVIAIARHSETLEALVVYEALYGERGWWVRPAAMFTELIEIAGTRQPRFARLE